MRGVPMACQLMGYAHHLRPSTRPQHRLLRWVPLTARCGRLCSGRCWCPTPAAFTARCHSWEWPRGGPCASTGLDQLGATGYSFLPLPPSEAVCSLQPATQGRTGQLRASSWDPHCTAVHFPEPPTGADNHYSSQEHRHRKSPALKRQPKSSPGCPGRSSES